MTMLAKSIKHFNDRSFDKATESGLVLVDFCASWCVLCRAQEAALDELVLSVGDKAVIAKVDVDDVKGATAECGVHSIPTLILLKDGKIVEKWAGRQDAGTLLAAINQYG